MEIRNTYAEDTKTAGKMKLRLALISGWLKIKIVFCSKLAVLHETEIRLRHENMLFSNMFFAIFRQIR